MSTDYVRLKDFATTQRQEEILDAIIAEGSQRKAAKFLKISHQNVQRCVANIQRKAERRLYSPEHGLEHPVPENFTGDFTRQVGPQGQTERLWVKGKLDKQQQEEYYLEFIRGLAESVKPIPNKKRKIKKQNEELASAIIFGDAHLGMLAHAVETLAEDHDLDRGIQDIMAAIDYCIHCAPDSEEGWFVNVGDFTHANTSKPTTPASGAILDVAARHPVVMKAAAQVMRYCIDQMLKKFNTVRVINARGNHDEDAGYVMNMIMDVAYEKEDRVIVIDNSSRFQFVEFGNTLVGINHGDRINQSRLAGVMTKTQSEAWGRTKYHLWWLGHIHHKHMQEHDSGIVFESFNTLAPIDYWHSASGYAADRAINMITLHREHGVVSRMAPTLEMVRGFYE